jgi:hypothetical protein
MTVKFGAIKTFNDRMSFKDWKHKFVRPGSYVVVAIFPPMKFPTFAIVFEDKENSLDVRLSVASDVFKNTLAALGLKVQKNDLPTLGFVIDDDLTYGLKILEEVDYVLEWTGNYWRRVKVNTKEDLPVEF